MIKIKIAVLLNIILLTLSCESFNKFYLRNKKILNLTASDSKEIHIKKHSNLDDVINLLKESNLLLDEKSFFKLALLKNYKNKNIVPGKYTINGTMKNNDLINHLRIGKGREEVKLTFNNCLCLRQLAEKISKQIEADSLSLMKEFNSIENINKYGFNKKTFPTLFIPNTYNIQWSSDAKDFLERMAKEYKKFWTKDRIKKAKKINLTQSEVSILASILEEEQNLHHEEWKTIAGVYINRLQKGWKLQADPTVKFALGDRTIKRILFNHLKFDSPYNTYIYVGIPPGPLRIPSSKSIDAVLNYKKHNYMFFCAKPGGVGYHSFAKTKKEHDLNAKKYHHWLNKK